MGEEIKEGGHNTRVQINHINLGNGKIKLNFIFRFMITMFFFFMLEQNHSLSGAIIKLNHHASHTQYTSNKQRSAK